MFKRCDGILKYDNNIHFVELKNRYDIPTYTNNMGQIVSSWYDKGFEQLIESISQFILHHNKTEYIFGDCYICNKQVFRRSSMVKVANFKNITALILENDGLILRMSNTIEIIK